MRREIYLVRHGHCEKSGALLGQADVPLTPEGVAQAERLAEQFAGFGIERVISSDLRRALETAERIASRIGVAVERDPRLREITYGPWDGHQWHEIVKSGGVHAAESFEDFATRVHAAWRSVLSDSARVIVVVAHLGVNAVLLGNLNLRQDYGSAVKLTIS